MSAREDLRALLKAHRAAFSMIEVAELSARISEKVLALSEYQRARRVLCYASIREEVNTTGLMREILRGGRELYLPTIAPGRELIPVRLTDPNAVKPGVMGIREPAGGEAIDPAQLDLLIVPGLAFDRCGGRLGYGAGYFDRLLKRCTGLVVALAFEFQIVDEIPLEPHDVPVDRIITERAVYNCRVIRAAAQQRMQQEGDA
ncbi:MAG: 5-formyltetrahydrofolate cyclo-ligase [Clostridiales bacterium]|nr:5-formyltetrahydrofolate cyclo-ligase [Clostridiales bacterium]